MHVLENALREDLNKRSPRVMAVLHPLKVVITNYPEGQVEMLEAVNNPEDPSAGSRQVPFSREIYVEQDDFREVAPKKYYRLAPGQEVRLRWGYFIRCTDVVKDPQTGQVVELHCTYDPLTRGGNAPDGRKVQGTIHWVSAEHALAGGSAALRLPVQGPRPRQRGQGGRLQDEPEPRLAGTPERLQARAKPGDRHGRQSLSVRTGGLFLRRHGRFTPGTPVFNRSVSLRDTWAKIEKKGS